MLHVQDYCCLPLWKVHSVGFSPNHYRHSPKNSIPGWPRKWERLIAIDTSCMGRFYPVKASAKPGEEQRKDETGTLTLFHRGFFFL